MGYWHLIVTREWYYCTLLSSTDALLFDAVGFIKVLVSKCLYFTIGVSFSIQTLFEDEPHFNHIVAFRKLPIMSNNVVLIMSRPSRNIFLVEEAIFMHKWYYFAKGTTWSNVHLYLLTICSVLFLYDYHLELFGNLILVCSLFHIPIYYYII